MKVTEFTKQMKWAKKNLAQKAKTTAEKLALNDEDFRKSFDYNTCTHWCIEAYLDYCYALDVWLDGELFMLNNEVSKEYEDFMMSLRECGIKTSRNVSEYRERAYKILR